MKARFLLLLLVCAAALSVNSHAQVVSDGKKNQTGRDIFRSLIVPLSKLKDEVSVKFFGEIVREAEKHASNGDPRSQYYMGEMYANGIAREKNSLQAMMWFYQSAIQGYPDAQFALYSLLGSEGGDPAEIIFWLKTAAEQGYGIAQFMLALEYGSGKRLSKNDKEAYFWLLLAATDGGPKVAEVRDGAALTIGTEERLEVQNRATIWRPTPSGPVVYNKQLLNAKAKQDSPAVTGSGFRIAAETVVTNYHVISNCAQVKVDGNQANVASTDPISDLAALKTARGESIGKIAGKRPSLGQEISVTGFPLRGVLTGLNITSGNISSLSGINGDSRHLQISAPVQPGNSGGPLLDSSGNVMGVVVSKLDALKTAKVTGDIPQNVNFAISANILRGFLDANNLDYELATSEKSLDPASTARKAQGFTTLIECWK